MKKIWTLWMASLFVMIVSAQETEPEKAFLEKAAALEKKMNATEDNKEEEKLLTEYIELYHQQPNEVKEKYDGILSILHYNLSYHQAAQGKKTKALKNFETACTYGFDDYQEVLNDSVFDILRSNKKFKALHDKMRATSDYLYILQQSGEYVANEATDTLPRFEYMMPNDTNLVRVRQYFNLDSVAGAGDELSKIKNLLDFVQILQEELIRAEVLPADYDFEAHKKLVPMQAGDVPITYADTTALERDFGFKPATPLREGLKRFAQWYKEFYRV